LTAPVAPSTVVRDPTSHDLWLFWLNRAGGNKVTWKQRTPLVLAVSHDNGATWSDPRTIESDPTHGYGYFSVDVVNEQVLLTYYDWADEGQKNFQNTNLRQRTIPLAWFHGQATPPVFVAQREPIEGDPPAGEESVAIVQNDRGTVERFETSAGGLSRSASADGRTFGEGELVLQPDERDGDLPGARFVSIRVFRHRGFYLGSLGVAHPGSNAVQPEWIWSHDGQAWARTRTACISLGDEGRFDSRTIAGGEILLKDDVLTWTYVGSRATGNRSVGRATLSRRELDVWLDSLPQP
jgi:hypothetical protein